MGTIVEHPAGGYTPEPPFGPTYPRRTYTLFPDKCEPFSGPYTPRVRRIDIYSALIYSSRDKRWGQRTIRKRFATFDDGEQDKVRQDDASVLCWSTPATLDVAGGLFFHNASACERFLGALRALQEDPGSKHVVGQN
jgi:hypothetical protein